MTTEEKIALHNKLKAQDLKQFIADKKRIEKKEKEREELHERARAHKSKIENTIWLQKNYKYLTGEDPDGRWSLERLQDEVNKAKEVSTNNAGSSK